MATSGSTRAYEFLDFNSPMDDATAAALVEEVSQLEPKRIVDIGCGWADGLHQFVRPGGRLILGTLFWEQPPAADLSTDFAEVTELPEILDAVTATDWRLLHQRHATAKDWDHFELGYMRDWEQLVLTADSKSEAAEAQSAVDDYRQAYLSRRGILGFVFLTLGRATSLP